MDLRHCANAVDRLETRLLRAELGGGSPGLDAVLGPLTSEWAYFWGWVVGTGALGGVALWYIGGWWYGLRARWSGAAAVDPRLARRLVVLAGFVFGGPVVVIVAIHTAMYPDYLTVWREDEFLSMLVLLFIPWSIVVSYIGATTTFEMSKWKARVWFLILPLVLYTFVVGVGVALAFVGMLGGELTGTEEEVTAAERDLLLDAYSMAVWLPGFVPNAENESLTKTRYSDGSVYIDYEYYDDFIADAPTLGYSLVLEVSTVDAALAYTRYWQDMEISLTPEEGCTIVERPEVFSWGDRSRFAVVEQDGAGFANLFVGQKDLKIVFWYVAGIYSDETKDISELLLPYLTRLDSYPD